jgi:hypothetical protein
VLLGLDAEALELGTQLVLGLPVRVEDEIRLAAGTAGRERGEQGRVRVSEGADLHGCIMQGTGGRENGDREKYGSRVGAARAAGSRARAGAGCL